ncbi:MAG: nuclear transport factor 2 family protein [Anaerolineae bacterium]|nr:nuclear transport factor 2 family protein [Anaerolineae bacterium]
MVARDASLLETLTSDLLSYGHSSGVIEDQAEFIRKVTNGKSSFTEITLTEQWVRVSGKTATVRHLLDGKTSINGTAGTVKLKVLLVFVQEKGKWLLLARQAVKIIFYGVLLLLT